MIRNPESPDSGKCSNYSDDDSDFETERSPLDSELSNVTPKKPSQSQNPVSRTLDLAVDENGQEPQEFTSFGGPEETKIPIPNEDISLSGSGEVPSTPRKDEVSIAIEGEESPDGDPEKNDEGEPEPKDNLQTKMWAVIDYYTAGWGDFYKENRAPIRRALQLVGLFLYLAFVVYACYRDIEEATVVLSLTVLGFLCFVYVKIRDHHGETIWSNCGKPTVAAFSNVWKYGKWAFYLFVLIGIGIGLFYITRGNPEQLISALGLLVFIFFTYIFSKHPRHVKWRPVIWGLILQFLLGVLILRTQFGYDVFDWLGVVTRAFLDFSDAGAKFVFGETTYTDHFFAFKVLPVVIYFSAAISVFYHYGIMQVVIAKIAWLMQNTMETSASESLNAAGNIFIGQTEAPLLIRPLLKDMTKSELHAVMTGGFATIAGSVLGAYITFGISASHLLSASVMSAPAALAISKLFYPETKKSSTKTVDQIELPTGEHRNVIEAASYGAYTAVPLALNIAGNLIAFLALLALLNGILGYMGALIGVPELSFEFICGFIFMPVAWLMGVDPKDCRIVAELIGAKTFINEFYAYKQLSVLIENRLNDVEPYISIRSEVIATYALCGFANVGSIGIQLGGLTPMAPTRKSDLADIAIRALVAGTIACFMTACVAGVLYDESSYDGKLMMLLTNSSVAENSTLSTIAATTGFEGAFTTEFSPITV